MQNILVCSSVWGANDCIPYNWNGLGFPIIVASVSLPPNSIVPPTWSVTFCIWTSVSALLREHFATLALSQVFIPRPSPSVNFPGKQMVWHMLFSFGSPIGGESSDSCWLKHFCAFCYVKPESANQSGRRPSYDYFCSYVLLSSAPSKWNSTTSPGNTDTTLLEKLFSEYHFFPPEISSWLPCAQLMELLTIFL